MPVRISIYSRRIGRGLSDPDLNPGETILHRPDATTRTAAAKYTAQYDSGLDVGLLGARVDPARATLREATGETVSRELAPLSHLPSDDVVQMKVSYLIP